MKRFALLGILALGATACGGVTDPAAATVGHKTITFERLEAGLDEFRATAQYEQLAAQGNIAAIERGFQQGFLGQLIRRAVLAPRARALGISIADEEVIAQIELIMADFPSSSAFEEALREQGTTLEELRDNVRDRLTEDAIRAVVTEGIGPTEQDIADFYAANQSRYLRAEVAHILVAGEAKARRLTERLRAAPANEVDELFARLARRESLDQGSAGDGGDLGVTQPDAFVAEFAEAVKSLEVGAISDPVRTEFGFHVIRVSDREVAPLEAVRAEIESELGGAAKDEAFSRWLTEVYGDVDLNARLGTIDPVTGAISDPGAEQVPGGEAPFEDGTEVVPGEPGPNEPGG